MPIRVIIYSGYCEEPTRQTWHLIFWSEKGSVRLFAPHVIMQESNKDPSARELAEVVLTGSSSKNYAHPAQILFGRDVLQGRNPAKCKKSVEVVFLPLAPEGCRVDAKDLCSLLNGLGVQEHLLYMSSFNF